MDMVMLLLTAALLAICVHGVGVVFAALNPKKQVLAEGIKRLSKYTNERLIQTDTLVLHTVLKKGISDDSLQANVRFYVGQGRLTLAQNIAVHIQHPQLRQSMLLYCNNAHRGET